MHHKSLRAAAAIVSMMCLAACAEPVTKTVTVTERSDLVETPVADAETPDALPQVIYYKISDS